MTSLSEFLLARIAEDEELAWDFERDPETRLPRFWLDRFRAECDAKRRIVEWGTPNGPDYVLNLLALPYADHPDYNPEWKP